MGYDVTDDNGYWEIGPIPNADDPGYSTLDLYAVWELSDDKRQVENYGGSPYRWYSHTYNDVTDGTLNFGAYYIPNDSREEGAMWIFQDMRRAWEYLVQWSDPGFARVKWERGGTGIWPFTINCFWPFSPLEGILIVNEEDSPDMIVHEMGHHYIHNLGRWPWDEHDLFEAIECVGHGIWDQTNPTCYLRLG